MIFIAKTTIARKLYNWYDDRVEKHEWCKLASPLGRRTQPLLSPASESSHPLRFRATQASTPDRDADCESCVAPDSPNLSIVNEVLFFSWVRVRVADFSVGLWFWFWLFQFGQG